MAELTTAGTMIGAVLETAGYMTQSEFLDSFAPLFQTGGAFLYIIAMIGGVFSFALFGSYRAVRYLILGPALYWFILGPRIEVTGAIWQIGDGKPRTVKGHSTELEAVKSVHSVIYSADVSPNGEKTGPETSIPAIRVSRVFWWFVNLINSVTHSFTRVILEHEDDDDLLFIAKTRVFESIINAEFSDKTALHLFQDMFTSGCDKMMMFGMARSSVELRKVRIEELRKQADALSLEGKLDEATKYRQTANFLNNKKNDYGLMYLHAAEQVIKEPSPTTVNFIADEVAKPYDGGWEKWNYSQKWLYCISSAGKNDDRCKPCIERDFETPNTCKTRGAAPATRNDPVTRAENWSPVGLTPIERSERAKRIFGLNTDLSCQTMFQITGDAVWYHAKKREEELVKDFTKDFSGLDPADVNPKERLCLAVAKKIGHDHVKKEDCDLTAYYFVMMMRNAITSRRFLGQSLGDIQNRMQFFNGIPKGQVVPLGVDPSKKYELIGGQGNFNIRAQEVQVDGETQYRIEAEFINKETGKNEWHPYTTMSNIFGHKDAAFIDQQRYQTRDLRQRIFTWSMQLPYWQGVILYFLAIAYPFFAMIVLVPGRAMAFFNIPLAWLWVKSWDIGFAFVMIFDKVIWELFPHSDLPLVIDNGVLVDQDTAPQDVPGVVARLVDKTDLDNILKYSLQVDPTYNIHAYYFLLSLALLSVPGLTGYATLKAKKGVLSSFVDGPNTLARDAGGKASNAYAAGLMNKKVAEMRSISSAGKMATGFRGSGLEGGGRHSSALRWAGMAAGADVASGFAGKGVDGMTKDVRDSRGNKTGTRTNWEAGAKQVSSSAQTGMDAYMKVLHAEVKHDAAYAAAFHKQHGRWSKAAVLADAQAAAIDGGGGYEINDAAVNAEGQLISTFSTKVRVASDMIAGIGKTVPSNFKQATDTRTYLGGGAVLLGLIYGTPNQSLKEQLSDDNEGAAIVDPVSRRTFLEKTFNFKDTNGDFQRAYEEGPPNPKDRPRVKI